MSRRQRRVGRALALVFQLEVWLRLRFRLGRNRWPSFGDLSYEAVTAFRNGFDEARFFRRIRQSVADFSYGRIEPVVKIHERIGSPQNLLQFVPGDNFAPPFQQDAEHLEGLVLDPKTLVAHP
ncbi:MAG TPA: hypothetical protein VNK47_05185 [Candidatus Dormibacteraeota bacterium]|nr:hypothetical protein [Candidatus Dormibacteraeota bacterium]